MVLPYCLPQLNVIVASLLKNLPSLAALVTFGGWSMDRSAKAVQPANTVISHHEPSHLAHKAVVCGI